MLPRVEILCSLSILKRVHIKEGFLEEMYQNVVATYNVETVHIR